MKSNFIVFHLLFLFHIFLLFSCNEERKTVNAEIVKKDTVAKIEPNSEGYVDYSDYPREYYIVDKNVFAYEFQDETKKLEIVFNIGDIVKVLGETDFFFAKNIDSLWTKVEISAGLNFDKRIAYIRSKNLGNAGFRSVSNQVNQYLLRRKNIKDTNGLVAYQLLWVKKGEIQKSIPLDTLHFNESMRINVKKMIIGIKNVNEIAFIEKLSEACGVESIEHIFLNIQDNLYSFHKNWSVGDAGVFYSSKDIYMLKNRQYFPISSYEEPQPIEKIPDEIFPYLDSPQYFVVRDNEEEVMYNEKEEEVMDENGDPVFKSNRDIYYFYKWVDKKGLKLVSKIDLIVKE